MRKVDPNGVRADFMALSTERMAHFERLRGLLVGSSHEKRDLSLLSETILHSVYVSFEVFISDLLLAYINRNPSVYQASLNVEIKKLVTNKLGASASARTSFSLAKHIKVQELEDLIDPTGWNLTFKNTQQMQQRFAAWTAPAHNTAIAALPASDIRLLDTTRAIRNFLAHRSSGSKKIMNDALLTISTGPHCVNRPLERGLHLVNDVGAYLKAVDNGTRRIQLFVSRLQAIAQAV